MIVSGFCHHLGGCLPVPVSFVRSLGKTLVTHMCQWWGVAILADVGHTVRVTSSQIPARVWALRISRPYSGPSPGSAGTPLGSHCIHMAGPLQLAPTTTYHTLHGWHGLVFLR